MEVSGLSAITAAMTMNTQELPFDVMNPEFTRNPHPIFAHLRSAAPALYWPTGKGYLFSRYRDVIALFRESRLGHDHTLGAGLPAEVKAAFPDYAAMFDTGFNRDPAEHLRIRKIVNPVFSPRAVEAHRPKIESVLNGLLDQLPREGVINVAAQYSRHYPVRVIAGMLGIPPGYEAEFVAFAEAIIVVALAPLPPDVFASYMPAVSQGMKIVRECIAERRAHPGENDLMSQLIAACDEEHRLSNEHLLSLVAGIVVGGSDTTVHLTSYAILELLRHPDQLALLRSDDSLARGALDETLRYNNFSRFPLPRWVTEPFSYEGVSLERGMPVYLNLPAAFRDPDFAPDVEVYNIKRPVTTSPWFGFGPHFCLGSSLARMEADIALRSFLRRYPSIELAGEPVYGTHPVIRDIVDLPLRVKSSPDA